VSVDWEQKISWCFTSQNTRSSSFFFLQLLVDLSGPKDKLSPPRLAIFIHQIWFLCMKSTLLRTNSQNPNHDNHRSMPKVIKSLILSSQLVFIYVNYPSSVDSKSETIVFFLLRNKVSSLAVINETINWKRRTERHTLCWSIRASSEHKLLIIPSSLESSFFVSLISYRK
jgi:hypothetical protein